MALVIRTLLVLYTKHVLIIIASCLTKLEVKGFLNPPHI